jgi:hypothetical protein
MVPELLPVTGGARAFRFFMPPDAPQIPTPDQLSTPFVDALIAYKGAHQGDAAADRTLAVINSGKGRYAEVVAGNKAQTRLLRARMADEAVSARLPLSQGRALVELAQSEFWANVDTEAKAAVGDQIIERTFVDDQPTHTFSTGVISEGFRFRKLGDPTQSPPVSDATYTVARTVVVNGTATTTGPDLDGNYTHTQAVTLPLSCDRAGAHGNTPYFSVVGGLGFTPVVFTMVDAPFDPLFTSLLSSAAGGSDGISDAAIRMLATANYTGQFAPTDGAILAGSLASAGVEHVAIVTDTTNALTLVFATDASWGASARFSAFVEQSLKDSWQGFGCQTRVRQVFNKRITVNATVPLVDPKYAAELTDITKNIGAALRKYFDERVDWYTWRLTAIRATIAGADRRILTCTAAEVRDETNSVLPEPPATLTASTTQALRYFLADNGVSLTISGP